MSVADAPILGMLRDTLSYLTQRQRLLADNVANANTPGYVPKDISESAFERALRDRAPRDAARLTVTSERHLASPAGGARFHVRAEENPDSEITINGNAVVLEEQMTKVVDAQMRYETVVGLYETSLGLLRMAARPPGSR